MYKLNKINKKGFSAVKIITIIAITSLWISISIPALIRFNIKANESHALNQMQKLTEACEKFKALHGKYPDNTQTLAEFIKEDLNSMGYQYFYECINDERFVLVALPDNSFSGDDGFYSDDDNEIIGLPGTNMSEGGVPVGMDGRTPTHPMGVTLSQQDPDSGGDNPSADSARSSLENLRRLIKDNKVQGKVLSKVTIGEREKIIETKVSLVKADTLKPAEFKTIDNEVNIINKHNLPTISTKTLSEVTEGSTTNNLEVKAAPANLPKKSHLPVDFGNFVSTLEAASMPLPLIVVNKEENTATLPGGSLLANDTTKLVQTNTLSSTAGSSVSSTVVSPSASLAATSIVTVSPSVTTVSPVTVTAPPTPTAPSNAVNTANTANSLATQVSSYVNTNGTDLSKLSPAEKARVLQYLKNR